MNRHLFARRAAVAGPLLLSAALLTGCINLAPDYERPGLPVPGALPAGAAAASDAPLATNELLRDERLRKVVQQALANNRDLRVAMLNIERSRAQLRLADADRWPTLAAAVNATRAPSTATGDQVNAFQAGLQVTSYELDLFGRVRNVSNAAAASLLATEAGSRTARLALVTQVVSTWFTLAADQEQLALAKQTLAGREQTLKLTELRARVGAASDVELYGTRGLLAQAQASVAQLERQAAQDANALALLVGQPVAAEALPSADAPLNSDALAAVPAGAQSDLLLRRPDVIQAEQTLIAANANIGAARAAMFPRIALSGSAGVVSDTLSGLVNSGTFAWTLAGNAALAIFDAGRNQANVKVAEVNRDIAVAQYEKAIQSAFRETADALVAQATWRDQVSAQQALQTGERERLRLTRMRYEAGAANLVELLDSERSLAAADQALVLARLGELLNRLALYKALGGEERAAS
ncbi:efflux transporter outer membrane subunit [Ideonella sp.]|uniref:efflux transporter outer membrane subunit n=1 Tax=Ideonella sp. TaxID=1929293 RepID=UPI0035B35EF8